MNLVKLYTLALSISLLSGCSFTSSLKEKADDWIPPAPYTGISVDMSPVSLLKMDNEDLKKLKNSKDIIDYITQKLLGGDNYVPEADIKKNVKIILAGDSWSFFDAVYGATESKLKAFNSNYNIGHFLFFYYVFSLAFSGHIGFM